jgi:hypothetical protein
MHFPSPTLNIRTSRCEVASELPGGGIALEAPKTARGRRTVQLPPFVVEALRQLKTEQNKLRLILGEDWATGNFVFTGPSTTSIKPLVRDEAGGPTADVRRSIYGVPVYLTSQLSIVEAQGSGTNLSSSYVYEAKEVIAVMREDVRVELDRSRLFNSDQTEAR